MNELQKKIYDYFERDTELRVLFIFQDSVDMFTTAELESTEWKSGYRYIDFKGDWFTTKYRLDNDWQNDKIVIYCHQESPLRKKSLQASFPLMDVLAANMEYHSQDYAAFMQHSCSNMDCLPTTCNLLGLWRKMSSLYSLTRCCATSCRIIRTVA